MNPEEALKNVFEEIKNGNHLGEPITLVGATKTVDLLTIQRAIDCGLKAVGENRVQEFREKAPFLHGAEIHFIGHLQTNKVKYLIGYVSLIHSVDSLPLAEEISEQSEKKGLVTDVLAEINIGKEPTKSGFSAEQAEDAMDKISSLPGIRAVGLMAMLPKSENSRYLSDLCLQMRAIYDTIKKEGFPVRHLSMGMSEDYRIAIRNGSNMIRLGRAIFGERSNPR
ncbi:MAG: YggS family pyridoxal phosphate-dependent enzyme [Firmicutes bacterium]|nr:YggS family pyridoxal phosphate-dependent enzyme [Bacillota bacterium]